MTVNHSLTEKIANSEQQPKQIYSKNEFAHSGPSLEVLYIEVHAYYVK